uniref:Uncharacterized protein n=1 Tax=Tanacetum cinerariifolium TaxID=118510 RepID=A0A6L2JAE4_TANCI|nr:hypothetical protein [Tanacetum cinerariifolium]
MLMKRIDELEQHMANLIQYSLALEEKLDKHGSRLYKLKNLNIPRQEILQQRMFEDKSYKDHKDHKKLYDALENSLERDYSDQLLSDLEKARQKKKKRRDLPPPPPHTSTGTSGSTQQQGNKALSSSNSASLAPQSMAWTAFETRYKSAGLNGTQELSLMDSLIPDDSIPDEQTIPSSNVSDVENNWATTLASTYVTPAESSLLAKTGDMMNFLNWYYRQVNKTKLTQADLKGHAYEVVDWTNPGGDQVRIDVNLPLPLGGPPGHVTIQSHDSSSRRKEVRSHMRILSVVRIKAYSRYGSTGLQSQGIQDQAAQSEYEYAFLDTKGRDKEQRVHCGY